MDPFPTELWTQIIQELHTPDWLVLSSTCRLLHAIAQAALYEKVRLAEGIFFVNPRISLFCRTLEGRRELGGLVRTLSITPRFLENAGPDSLAKHPLFPQLSLFSGLRVLELINFTVDADFCATVYYLPNLHTVRFIDCYVSPTFSQVHAPPSVEEKPLDVVTSFPEEKTAVGPTDLRSLDIGCFLLGPLFTKTILSHIVLGGWSHLLTRLIIRGTTIPSTIVPFLLSAPQIRHFSLPYFVPSDCHHPIHSLPLDAVRLLEHFAGSADLCALFIKGRPVRSVDTVFSEKSPKDVLLSLRLSSVAVTRLMLRFYEPGDDMGKLDLPITLRHLSWSRRVCKTLLMSWRPALSRLPNLQAIEGCVYNPDKPPGPFDDFDQEEVVQAISKACPLLRDFTFTWVNSTRFRWIRWEDGHWERYVQVTEK